MTLPFTHDEIMARYGGRVSYVNVPSRCWIWEGKVNNWGYGVMPYKGHGTGAHRVFYEMLVGPIPDGMVIDHTCRNHLCVNPAHLQPVTHGENVALGRTRNTHCPHGHTYGDAYLKGNARVCRECVKIRNHKAYLRRQAKES